MAKITILVRANKENTGIEYSVSALESEEGDNEQIKSIASVLAQGCSATMHGLVKLISGESQLEEIVKKKLNKSSLEVPRIVLPPGFDPKKH